MAADRQIDVSDGLDAMARSSILPGWSVQDIVAHMVGTESMLAGETAPEAKRDLRESDHVRNDIAAMNEQWVELDA